MVTTCKECAVSRGLPWPLTLAERQELTTRILLGTLDRDALKQLRLHPHDEDALELYLPKATRPGHPRVPGELARIAEALKDKVTGSALLDPILFLILGDESRVRPLLFESDWSYVKAQRTRHSSQ